MSADYRCHQPAAERPARSPMRTPPPRDHQFVSAWDSRVRVRHGGDLDPVNLAQIWAIQKRSMSACVVIQGPDYR
jgi:hypothetical protein